MRSLTQKEMLTVSGAGTTTDTSTAKPSRAAKLAAIKAKVAELLKKHAAGHSHAGGKGLCSTTPTPTPEDSSGT